MKREDRYKESLNNLMKENEELRYSLADIKCECNRNELLNKEKEVKRKLRILRC